jgi:hypothetical protein
MSWVVGALVPGSGGILGSMTRRRFVLAPLAAAALGAAWWLLSDGLTAEERRLVGTWA